MLEIRFHGRGGSGSVLGSRALAKAAFYEEKYAVSFPSFGAERRGSLVLAFARINDRKIFRRTQIYTPDIVVVLNEDIPELIDIVEGLKPGGIVVLNSTKKPEQIILSKSIKVGVVKATKIAQDILDEPITNTAMLGALVKSTGIISLENLEKGIFSVFKKRLGETIARKNVEIARIAHKETILGVSKAGKTYAKMHPWRPTVDELPLGTILPKSVLQNGQEIGPGAAKRRKTGTWSKEKAVVNQEKCIECLKCLFHCPEGTIYRNSGKVKVNNIYCKTCGICVSVCPVNAISIEEIEDYTEIII